MQVIKEKILPQDFRVYMLGIKSFEIRKENSVQAGDIIEFHEWDGKNYTGKSIRYWVTYISQDTSEKGLKEGYCIIGMTPVGKIINDEEYTKYHLPDYSLLIESCLIKLNTEYERLYWNRHQKEADSPFYNTGITYSNGTFSVKAYDWSEKGNIKPNFEYAGLKVWWYKHCFRELTYEGIVTADFLQTMLKDCIESMRKDFGER